MTHPELEDKLYTSSEVAKLLGVSLRSLYRYIKAGKLVPETTTLSGRHRFSKDQIEKFLYPKGGGPEEEKPKPTPPEHAEEPVHKAPSDSEPSKDKSRDAPSPPEEEPEDEESEQEATPEEEIEPIADDGEIVKEAEISTGPLQEEKPQPPPPPPPPPPEEEEEKKESEESETEPEPETPDQPSPPSPPTPPQEDEVAEDKPEIAEEDLEKLRLEALKKVSGEPEEPKSPAESLEPSREEQGETSSDSEPSKDESGGDVLDLGPRERVLEVEGGTEEQPKPGYSPDTDGQLPGEPIPPKPPSPPKEEEDSSSEALAKEDTSPLEGFSAFDKKCRYFYSPVGDLKQIAQKIHQFGTNAGKQYAFTLLAGLSLHKDVPPFSVIHLYLKEPDFAFFKGVLKLSAKSKEEANIGIIFEKDPSFWEKVRTLNNYHVASDKRLYDDLSAYSSETKELAEDFKPSMEK